MKKSVILILFTLSLLILSISLVSACSCMPPQPPREAMEEADAVFLGKVMYVKEPFGNVRSGVDPVKVTFDVEKVWKGLEQEKVIVETALGPEACGYTFTKGESYVVYAYASYADKDTLQASLCSRTKTLAQANEDLQALGEGTMIKGVTTEESPKTLSATGVIGVIIIVLGVYLIRKRGKRR